MPDVPKIYAATLQDVPGWPSYMYPPGCCDHGSHKIWWHPGWWDPNFTTLGCHHLEACEILQGPTWWCSAQPGNQLTQVSLRSVIQYNFLLVKTAKVANNLSQGSLWWGFQHFSPWSTTLFQIPLTPPIMLLVVEEKTWAQSVPLSMANSSMSGI